MVMSRRDQRRAALLLLLLSMVMNLVPMVIGIETSGPSCSVQTTGGGLSRSQCPNGPVATLEQAKENAWRLAPVVKFHPLEKYYMESMPVWYSLSKLETQGGLEKEYRTVLGGNTDAVLSGAPFDETGASTADVYYTVQEYDGDFWLFNFDLFFGWNGCSNQEFVLGSQQLRYLMCPAGVHETDLERMSVLVCKTDLNTIKKIGYNQHAWSEVRDCDAGIESCPRDPSTGNPIVYAGLESHALYPENNGFHVYYNLGPLFVGDRTGDDPNKFFKPTEDNVKYIPPYDALPNTDEWDWARFGGNWGKLIEPMPVTLACLSDDTTKYVDCPDSSAKSLIISVAGTQELSEPLAEQVMMGPLFRPANYQIKGTEIAPIIESGVTKLKCPDDILQRDAIQEMNTTMESPQDFQSNPVVTEPAPPPRDILDSEQVYTAPPPPSIRMVPPGSDQESTAGEPAFHIVHVFFMGILLLAANAW